jgi:hypothetical protein
MTAKVKETHYLAEIIRARHAAGDCITGCPACVEEEAAAKEREFQEYLNRMEIYEIMPRNPQAKGLEFQAGIYVPTGGGHMLIAEVYDTASAIAIADLMTVASYRYLEGFELDFTTKPHEVLFVVKLIDPSTSQPLRFSAGHQWEAMHEAAEHLRHAADPHLDRHRAQTMADKGLEGEWGKWESR